MRIKEAASLLILLVVIFSFSQNSFAQNDKPIINNDDYVPSIQTLNTDIDVPEPVKLLENIPKVPSFKEAQKEYLLDKMSKYNRISYTQGLSTSDLGFGGYKHYTNTFSFSKENKYSFNMGVGLAIQNSLLNATNPLIQYSISSGVEYALFKGVSIYFRSQYLSSSLNNGAGFDPFIHMNPFYLQSEIGYGVKTEYKNIKADVGMKSMYDTQFKTDKSINSMNTKVSIGF